METFKSRKEIRDRLAEGYQELFDRYSILMDEATAAERDGDHEAFDALTRRADKLSDTLHGIGIAAELIGIDREKIKVTVNDEEEQ